jgi:tetratricopeptide (TPR) repeat protein
MHTGLVVVGEIGGGGRQEQLALGDTPNIAARLQGLAAPDTIVISEATARLVEGYFLCEALGRQELKGLAAPLHVYRVLHASETQTRLDIAAIRGLTPLVGREADVSLLRERWTQVQEGLGQVVLLNGEPGIGKSRLVQALKEHLAGERYTRIEYRCAADTQHSALYPVITHLERALAFAKEDTPEDKLQKLETALASAAVPLPDTVPLVAALLSLPFPAHYPPLTLTPQRQRQHTLEALLAWLVAEATRQPVLFIVEDLHWIDPSTLEFVTLLIEQGPPAPILTVLTCRPEFHPPWPLRAHVTLLTLGRLAPPQVAQMMLRVTGDRTLPLEIVQQVVTKTDGVPLFVEELTKMVLESGFLHEAQGTYELTAPLPPLAIPTTLHDSLMARLDRLSTVKTVAQLGAAIGRTFAYELLQAVAPLDEALLQQGLQQLVAAELGYQRGRPPQATYMFKHALIQDAAYQSLLRSTRQQYHQQIAQVIETRFPDIRESQPELLAHHYSEAGLSVQALPYWQRAGQRAMERSGYREAVACFEQALVASRRLPERRDTLEQAIDLRLALRSALLPAGDLERILAVLREAEALAATLGDQRRLGQVSLFLTVHFYQWGAYEQAISCGQRALEVATAEGNMSLQALANQYLGVSYQTQGDYRRAIAYFQDTVAFLDGARRRERFGQVILPAVYARAFLAWCYAELGLFTEGQAHGEEGLQIVETVDHPGSLMFMSWGRGVGALCQGDVQRALPLLERALSICHTADLPGFVPRVAPTLGEVYVLCGRVADAVPLITQALAQTMAAAMVVYQALCHLALGKAQVLAGALEEAQNLAQRAFVIARQHRERGNQAYALQLLGEIAAHRDPPDVVTAAAHYEQALTLAEELGMRPLQAHCHRGLGTLYAATGQREPARAELSAAIALYRAMEMTFWLPQTEAVLAQVEGH